MAAVEQEALADFRLAVEISSLQPALTQPYYRSWLDYVGTLAHRARDEGALRSDVDPEALARVVIAAITGMDLISDVFSGGTDLLGRQREFWSILLPQVMEDNQASAINGILDRVLADG